MIQEENHIFQGLKRDNHQIRQEPQFLWNAHNIRLTNRDDSTLLSITNERGTKPIDLYKDSNKIEIQGEYVGHCVVGKYLVLFTTTGEKDYIYRIEDRDNNSCNVITLYGDWPLNTKLGFNVKHPIEAFSDIETDLIQKVYWTDGEHQPRVINIKDIELNTDKTPAQVTAAYTSSTFDFIRELKLEETVEVEKRYGDGIFSPGTIQYAFTYYNKYKQETNIFYTTPIYYISPKGRGGNPEERISNNFNIKVTNPDKSFDFIRVYSIHRTSIDAVPTVLRIGDIEVPKDPNVNICNFIDSGTIGDTVDSQKLFYIGGEEIIAGTICAKDGTLFLGNIKLNRDSYFKDDIESAENKFTVTTELYESVTGYNSDKSDYYDYNPTIEKYNAKFKSGEWYRLGVQFQHKTGKWSEPIFVKDDQIPVSLRPILSYIGDGVSVIKSPIFKISIDSEFIELLRSKGYKKVRGLYTFPTTYDKTIVAQGLLCPTVFNAGYRNSNTPFVQSSWFVRPFIPLNAGDTLIENNKKNIYDGSYVEYRHLHSLINNLNRGGEIQSMNDSHSLYEVSDNIINGEQKYNNQFFVDQSIVTFHSPDIEWNDSVYHALKDKTLHLRIVGYSEFNSNIGDISIQTSSPAADTSSLSGSVGFNHQQLGSTINGGKSLVSGLFYNDSAVTKDDNGKFYNGGSYRYMVYPWNRSGSLNNDVNRGSDGGTRTAVLSKKIISNLKFANKTIYFNSGTYWEPDDVNVQVFNSDQIELLKLKAPSGFNFYKLNYYGNVNTLLTTIEGGIVVGKKDSSIKDDFTEDLEYLPEETIEDTDGKIVKSKNDPIRIKYKSSPHAVFVLTNNNKSICLPGPGNTVDSNVVPFWTNGISKSFTKVKVDYYQSNNPLTPEKDQRWIKIETQGCYPYIYNGADWISDTDYKGNNNAYYYYEKEGEQTKYWKITDSNPPKAEAILFPYGESISFQHAFNKPYLYIAELYKDKPTDIFGGESEEAKRNNLWLPASDVYSLDDNSIAIKFIYGDTWYSRYDCLKTYPFTEEDENQLVEIVSFMCESRVNADGRYDRNRGLLSNLAMRPTNFNLINPIYDQKDNFFNHRILDSDFYKQDTFTNQITWSLEKTPGSDIDLWTNITLANTLDIEGTSGSITAIRKWNNQLLCFQEKALSQINFNSRVQIPVTDGVPIEITNSYKVDGSIPIVTNVGCTNKWSIEVTDKGVYFIDANTKEIYLYNGQLNPISSNSGMDWWVKYINPYKLWYPTRNNTILESGIRTFYDSINGDAYFSSGEAFEDALCYSEKLQAFTSFMSYGGVQAMFNFNNGFYSLKNDITLGGNKTVLLYKNNEGNYNSFYGETKGWNFSFISNQNPTLTKIFDTIELRGDTFSTAFPSRLLNSCPINYIEASNEYQSTGVVKITDSNMRKKFRVWRGLIPRSSRVASAQSNGLDAIRNKYGRARMRNPWTMITLGWDPEIDEDIVKTNSSIIHDLSVKYTI